MEIHIPLKRAGLVFVGLICFVIALALPGMRMPLGVAWLWMLLGLCLFFMAIGTGSSEA